ncbi:MAG TPA: ROK family protein [Pseudonocardiaceae bacterium]|nr:ROK family protein [Pseudonocardiaceae bacterium]
MSTPGLTIGVDVGGTSVRAGVVDGAGMVQDIRHATTPAGAQALEDVIVGLVSELGAAYHGVRAIGLAVAGFVTADRSQVGFCPHLAWRGVPVADRIERRLGLPVVLEHDANAAALAEHRYGRMRDGGVAVLVLLGTGIGGALLVDGALFRGAHGVAPELGHLRLVPDGRPCACGKRGCWERYCSGTGLVSTALELLAQRPGARTALAQEASGNPGGLSGAQVVRAARDGDPVALQAMVELARWLGEGLALLADVYDPELVVIGGGMAQSAALFLERARAHYAASVTGAGYRTLAHVRTAQLGTEAGIVGAALLARSRSSGS